jgi:Domain of unknown function (DUF1707)/2TM domain
VSEAATPASDLRASDAEREHIASTLRDHAAVGRLGVDELAERVEMAYKARTRAELDALVTDLPRSSGDAKQLGFKIHRGIYTLVILMLVAIWALTGGGYFWPIWPMLGWGIGVLSHAAGCRRAAARG